ncbi:modulator of macroautophagy TMEM150B [Cyprinodon tularosa]|uniref:modulator of macroautophagy TMEM150B n=1 Tax=Cyprinodon tularosa TaxID=77115 RepID=UPI0018E21E77|nr:modulator of macroautophagy TMEM150B [Cyprinodon tularosa]
MGPLFAIPILAAVNGIAGIWAVYGIALHNGTVNLTDHFPYISHCGAKPPASCWFSQVCNNGCILALIFDTVRFLAVKNHSKNRGYNIASFVLGIFSAVGLSITGNFQVSNNVSLHYIGAVLAFFGGLVYLWFQLFLISDKIVKYIGYVVCSICTILIICMTVFHFCEFLTYTAICEWTLATSFFLLYPLFVFEFSDIDLKFTINTKGSASASGDQPLKDY